MDGDKAPLAELLSLADRHGGFLIVDEAHATGVFGKGGRGLAEGLDGRDNVIVVRTCGKALGCEGALICAARPIVDFLINRGCGSRAYPVEVAPAFGLRQKACYSADMLI
jgi:8-amino-7-oxononanoate synthase